MTATIGLRCPACGAWPGQLCVTASGRAARSYFHKSRLNTPGFDGRDNEGRQFCRKCQRWKFPAIHSCPGVPQ